MQDFVRIFSFLGKFKLQFLFALLLSAFYTTSNVLFMPLAKDLINEISNKNLDHFNNHIINAILLYAIRLISQFSQIFMMTKISMLMSLEMRMVMYRKFLHQSQRFYGDFKLGDMLARLGSDVEIVKDAIIAMFAKVIPQILTLVAVISYLFYLNWKLTLFTTIFTPAFIGIIMWAAGKLKRTASQIQRKSADISHITQETLSNIKLVQAYTMEEREATKFHRENMRSIQALLRGLKVKLTTEPFIAFTQFLAIAFVIWYGGYEVSRGNLTGPELAGFFTGIMLLIDPIIALSEVYTELQKSTVSIERFYAIIDAKNDIENSANPHVITPLKGEVEFKNVGFKYDGSDETVLKNISLKANRGKVIALVGLSGAGKTTLINLIPRFYDITSGEILIDGINIKDHDLHTLRSQISIVPQEDIIFRGTIVENVRYGQTKEDIKQKDVIEALKKANAWEFIEKMPKGLYEKVGDKGRRLSGGQKQRISIARAILNDPKVLLLDEATSALDSKSEKLVQEALDKLMANRTTFVIAHRLSTIIHADQIILLDNGTIKESGTHEDLLEKGGAYAELYQMQFKKKSK